MTDSERRELDLLTSVGVYAHALVQWRAVAVGLREQLDAVREALEARPEESLVEVADTVKAQEADLQRILRALKTTSVEQALTSIHNLLHPMADNKEVPSG